jgi:tetratricopeptide (TPR) repeat protein
MNARILASAIVVGLALTGCQSAAAGTGGANAVAQAKQLLDTYYGLGENLDIAGALLETAMKADVANADTYVQAARQTIMSRGRPAVKAYHDLLDKALSIDPANRQAYILKAEAFDIQRNYPKEKACLDEARELGSRDSWLWMGYARYYGRFSDETAAQHFYAKVEELGPGATEEQRHAYVRALGELARFDPPAAQPSRLKELAARAWRERHPADPFTLEDFSEEFGYRGMYDEALVYAREAVRSGSGPIILAVSLYAKAAQLVAQDKQSEADRLVLEAARLGFKPSGLSARLEHMGVRVESLTPSEKRVYK